VKLFGQLVGRSEHVKKNEESNEISNQDILRATNKIRYMYISFIPYKTNDGLEAHHHKSKRATKT
jgi:hypothetical protein